MKALIETADKKSERAFLVGVELKSHSAWDVADSLDELAELATTAGVAVVGQGIQRLEAPHSGTFIGAGKAEEFAKAAKEANADTVLFDEELSGAQARNLEEIFSAKVIDRTALILDIFAQRARTREGKLQVELAQLQYLMPRLTRYWTHLSRQRGSTGSIGRNALKVVGKLGWRVLGMAAKSNTDGFPAQVRVYRPKYAAVFDHKASAELKGLQHVTTCSTSILFTLVKLMQTRSAKTSTNVKTMDQRASPV